MGRDHQGQGEAYVPPQLSAKQQCESVPKNVGAFLCVSGAQWEWVGTPNYLVLLCPKRLPAQKLKKIESLIV